MNETGEYNITYQIKENNFKMSKMFTEVKNLISVEMTSKEDCILNYKPTIIFVEHDEKFIYKIATKVVRLEN